MLRISNMGLIEHFAILSRLRLVVTRVLFMATCQKSNVLMKLNVLAERKEHHLEDINFDSFLAQ